MPFARGARGQGGAPASVYELAVIDLRRSIIPVFGETQDITFAVNMNVKAIKRGGIGELGVMVLAVKYVAAVNER